MNTTGSPPKWTTKLLRAALPAAERETVCAELAEWYRLRCAQRGKAAAKRWYRLQVPILFLRFALENARSKKSLSGLSRRRKNRKRGIMESIRQDVRDAIRSLVKNPGLTIVAVLTLSLGIGANAAIFSAVDGVVLKPLPYPDPQGLHWIYTDEPPHRWSFSVVDFQALQRQATSFRGTAAFSPRALTLTDGARAQRVVANRVTADFFSVLGVHPFKGRAFRSGEDAPEAEPVVVISHGFWQRQFSGRDVLGQAVRLDGADYTIVGILPEKVGPIESASADVFPVLRLQTPTRKGPFFLRVVARLKEGVAVAQAEEELRRINRDLFPIWRQSYQNESTSWGMAPLRDYVVGDSGTSLYVLLAAVGLVLLIASTNVGGLLLARNIARRPDMALRAAIGASRGRLIRQMLAESMTLAALGCAFGAVLARLGTGWLISMAPNLPRAGEITVDLRVLAFTMLVSLIAGLLLGIAPAIRGSVSAPATLLRSGGRTAAARSLAGRVLVIAQFALSLPVLISAGLLLNSFMRLHSVNPGFDAERIAALRVSLPSAQYPSDKILPFWDRALTRIGALPGLEAVALADSVPPQNVSDINNFDLESRPTPAGESQPTAPWLTVTPGYFQAMGIPLVQGRLIHESDSAQAPPVVVVDTAWIQRHFPGGNPVGERLMSGGCTPENCDWVTIVGVVGDVKYTGLENSDGAMYFPQAQAGYRNMYVIARASGGNPLGLAPDVRKAIAEIDPMLVVSDIRSGDQLVADSLLRRRFLLLVVSAFGILAVALTSLGIYGTMSYFVQQRRREIGVRMALGGRRGNVLGWLLGRGMRLTLAGIVLGLLGAAAATRYLVSLLYGVGAGDPLTFSAVTLILAAVSLLACWLPARRASKVDPVVVLRQ